MNKSQPTKDEPPESLKWAGHDGLYKYDRRATEDRGGSIALSQLRDDEVVVFPGFIYRRVS